MNSVLEMRGAPLMNMRDAERPISQCSRLEAGRSDKLS
jgi:hypothetical protein